MEIEALRQQRDELLVRERMARAEADRTQHRLLELSSASKKFASTMRNLSGERQRSRRRLSVQYAVGRVLAEARSLKEAAPDLLDTIGRGLGWDVGVLWMPDEAVGVLGCAETWRPPEETPGPFEETVRTMKFPRGLGLPGRVWAAGTAVCVEDVTRDGGFFPREAAGEEGLRRALAFPIRDGGWPLGVVEFLGRDPEPVDEDLLQTVNLIGHQIGQFVERRWAEEERERLLRRERAARVEAERARERVTSTLESISDAFFSLDWERRFTYVNREAERLWRRERGALLGRRIWEVFPKAVGTQNYRAIEQSIKEQATTRFDDVSPVIDRWVSGTVYPSATGVSVYFRDVTEQRRAEKGLRESEERFRLMADAVPQIVWITDDEGRVEFFNKQWSNYTGASHEPTTAAEVAADFVHPDDGAATLEAFAEARRLGGVFEVEHRIKSAAGNYRWFLVRAEPYRDRQTGEIVRWFGASVDIHDRKLAEAALRESEERFRSLIQHASDIITVLAPDGTILYESPSVERVLGYAPEEMVGEPVISYVHPEDAERVREAGAELLERGGITDPLEVRFRHKDGSWRHLEAIATNLLDHPVVKGIVVNSRDITERKAAEAARDEYLVREREARDEAEAAQERLAFAAGASEERRRISRELHDRVAHSMGVVHQSLELYRAFKDHDGEAAEAKIELARNLAKNALDSTRDLSMALRDSEVEEGLGPALSKLLGTIIPPEVRYAVSVEGDESLVPPRARDQLFLILREAVRNAALHSGARQIAVELDVSSQRALGRVEDDGRGLDPEAAGNGATGGLRSMRERASLLGGTLALKPGAGDHGTRVEVVVPLGRDREGDR